MKLLIVLGALIASTTMAQAATATFSGTYRSGSFLNSVPATLTVRTNGNAVSAVINAPGTDCLVAFGAGQYAGTTYAGTEVYKLPVTRGCGEPRGYGPTRNLLIDRNANGSVRSIRIVDGNGKMNWTYFSN